MSETHSPPSTVLNADQRGFHITLAGREDVEALVHLHLQCFSERDHIAVMFGAGFVRAVFEWFVTSPNTFVLAAKASSTLVGFTALADGPYNGPMLRAAKKEALLAVLRRPRLAFHPELLRRAVRLVFPRRAPASHGKTAHVAFTAVDENHRGVGIATALKQESIRMCRARGLAAIVTGIKKENGRARALNERAGFVEVPGLSTKRFSYLSLSLAPESRPRPDPSTTITQGSPDAFQGVRGGRAVLTRSFET
jgi:ribosomal protein S18 acetylase RimI-like enzyme